MSPWRVHFAGGYMKYFVKWTRGGEFMHKFKYNISIDTLAPCTLTSLHWRQGRQHLRRSHGSAPSMQSCPRGTMPSSQSRSIESLGAWGPCALEFCADLGGRLARHTGVCSGDCFSQAAAGHGYTAGQCRSSGGHAG